MADTTGGTFKYWKDGLPTTPVKKTGEGSFKHWFNGSPSVIVFVVDGGGGGSVHKNIMLMGVG